MKSAFFACCLLLIMAPLPLFADYVLYESYDSPGGDLATVSSLTVKKMHAYCDNLANCVGFNTNGTFKSSLQPVSQWNFWTSQPLKGFYRRVSNYNFTAGMDTPGGDIKTLSGQSVPQLKVACDETPSCIGFNTAGTLKSSVQPKGQWTSLATSTTSGLYLKANVIIPPPAHYNYAIYKDTHALGSTYSYNGKQYNDEQSAKDACDASQKCVGVIQWGTPSLGGGYFIQTLINPISTWYDHYSSYYGEYRVFIKILYPVQATLNTLPVSPRNPPSNQGAYTYNQGLVVSGEVAAQIVGLTIDQLKTYCDSLPQCPGFTTDGTVYKSLVPKAQWTTVGNKQDGIGFVLRNSYTG